MKSSRKQAIVLTAKRGATSPTGSKFGGEPYFPKTMDYPHNANGEPLRLLAQLNFAELPHLADFPEQGILQFFIANNVFYGADFDDMPHSQAVQDGFRVIFHQEILPESERLMTFPEPAGEDYFPLRAEFTVTGELGTSIISLENHDFEKIFIKKYKQITGEEIEGHWDLEDDECELLYDTFGNENHQIGGYPSFTQDDIRMDDTYEPLLFQMTSQDNENDNAFDILWGDVGVANFFIPIDKLRTLDFSDVLYNWDCS